MRYYSFVLFFLSALPRTSLGTPLVPHWGDMRVQHFWNVTPDHWEHLSTPSDSTTINLRIALKSHNENALIEALYEVSSPDHPNYRAHLSQNQVAELVAPHSDTLDLTKSWLESYGIPSSSISMTHSGSWLKVTRVPVSQANELLGASYQLYRHAETNETILRTMSYSLPIALQDHVGTIAPTTFFGSPRNLRKTHRMHEGASAVPTSMPREVTGRDYGGNDYITPSYITTLYNTAGYVPNATSKNVFGISAFDGSSPSLTDVNLFMQQFFPDVTMVIFNVVPINGAEYDPGQPNGQEDFNLQYAEGLTYPTPVVFYSTGGLPPFKPDDSTPTDVNEPFLDWLEYMLDQPNIPQTITVGYGDNEQTVPLDYATNVCILFAQFGARGVSVLFASGDSGVGMGDCMANDGSGDVHFLPMFPASCPYVTSVGGTMDNNPEVGAGPSGGGFSNYFERPSYQSSAVSAFLQTLGGQYEGLYNASSRGYPDVSAQYYNYTMIFEGEDGISAGSSTAATVFASIISLLNDFLLAQNEPPLGFLNPWLYGHGQVGLNDITSGSNPGCNTNGFSAVVGWDPVTGLGTPNFVNLRETITW